MTPERADWLRDVAEEIRGSRRLRHRLLAELESHLEDAAAEEVAAGASPAGAEESAIRRLGAPATVAASWNADVVARRSAARLRVIAAVVVVAAVAAPVAVAQRSGDSPRRPQKPAPVKVRPAPGAGPARAS